MRRARVGLVCLALAPALSGCLFAAPRWQGPPTDHFDGEKFVSPPSDEAPAPRGTFGAFLRWVMNREPGPWREFEDFPPGPPPPRRVPVGALRVTFVNHATVLVQLDGVNILTDPIWSSHATPLPPIGPARKRPPGLRFEDLPPIDVVLLSHNHYDHTDLPTLERLWREHRPRFVTGLGNRALLRGEGLGRVSELDWWQSVEVAVPQAARVRVTSAAVRHFSNRGLTDRDGTLWTGFVVEGPSGPVYFDGDTGYGPQFREARERFGRMRLAILPIGAFRPEWFMAPVHMSPEDAVRAYRDLGAGAGVGVHFGTFPLADDGQDEPATRLLAALRPDERFWVLGFGEGRDVPPLE